MARDLVIGDVHGCLAELGDLLARLGPASDDEVVFVGDLVARGPDSAGVVALARELGASLVLGNHEARLLAARRGRRGEGPRVELRPDHERVFRALRDEDWRYLEAAPLIRELIPGELVVTHAGVVPGVALADQEPDTLLHVRSIDEAGRPSSAAGRASWSLLHRSGPHVVFGHDARRGLQLHERATGLDTGCVYGGELSALVLPRGALPPPPRERRDAIVAVPARQRYAEPGT